MVFYVSFIHYSNGFAGFTLSVGIFTTNLMTITDVIISEMETRRNRQGLFLRVSWLRIKISLQMRETGCGEFLVPEAGGLGKVQDGF